MNSPFARPGRFPDNTSSRLAPATVRTDQLANSIGTTFRLIPAGEFMMGSPEDDKEASDDEKPQHRVRITRPFYVGVYPVTQAEYQALMRRQSELVLSRWWRQGQELPASRQTVIPLKTSRGSMR